MRDRSVIFGLVLVISGLIIWQLKFHFFGGFLLVTGIVFLITLIINLRKPEYERILDERVERINEKSGYYAFWVLILSLAAFTALNWYFKLKLREMLEYLFIIGMYSYIILRFYYSRKALQ